VVNKDEQYSLIRVKYYLNKIWCTYACDADEHAWRMATLACTVQRDSVISQCAQNASSMQGMRRDAYTISPTVNLIIWCRPCN